jgi:photosystem II Psb27 protein|mmetsp:Transcript_14069/g.59288  ORF Transcript_14069/g.59288 Transcript_14069/m.59288 type:complete len:189 (+) Transcript_14069:29-595(+)
MVAVLVTPVSLTSAPRAATRSLRAGVAPARAARAVSVRASAEERQVEATTSRREVAFKAFAALTAASAVRPAPALALFGLGGDPIAKYTEQTTAVIEQVKYTLDLPTDSPDKAGAIEKTRQLTNAWVAKYRRDKAITGRPSYGNVYSALNAVSGHYNNFGTKYPLPAKRKDRVLDEFKTAEIALSRGR